MLFDEQLRDAIAQDRRRELAEGLRLCEFDLPRRGLLARWRARQAARSATPVPAPAPAPPAPPLPPLPGRAPERTAPPRAGIRRTMPDMYR